MKSICRILVYSISIYCIFVLIKYSNVPVVDLPLNMEDFFIKPEQSDGIVFGLAQGYIVSFIFYLLVVFYPERVKKQKVEKEVIKELQKVCDEALMLVVLMYKNVCRRKEWHFYHLKDDAEFFDEQFYIRMKKFDAYKDADTLMVKIEDDGTERKMSWDDKLERDFKRFTYTIDQVITRYIFFLDEEIIEKANSFKNNMLMSMYLDLPADTISIYTGKNGLKYAERVPVNMFRKDPSGKKAPLFSDNNNCENIYVLEDYVNALLQLRKLCNKKRKTTLNIAIDLFCHQGCGQNGIVIVNS